MKLWLLREANKVCRTTVGFITNDIALIKACDMTTVDGQLCWPCANNLHAQSFGWPEHETSIEQHVWRNWGEQHRFMSW